MCDVIILLNMKSQDKIYDIAHDTKSTLFHTCVWNEVDLVPLACADGYSCLMISGLTNSLLNLYAMPYIKSFPIMGQSSRWK